MKRPDPEKRCERCRINRDFCFCDQLTPVAARTRVSIVMHHRERFLTSNTAHLAQLVLPHCELHLRGQRGGDPPAREFLPLEGTIWYLLPDEGARALDESLIKDLPGPLTLVVPDGTWRQAAKIKRRSAGLDVLASVMLPQGAPSRYVLRTNHRPEGLCTYEAIARAIGVVEGPELQHQMEANLDAMVRAILRSRPPGPGARRPPEPRES